MEQVPMKHLSDHAMDSGNRVGTQQNYEMAIKGHNVTESHNGATLKGHNVPHDVPYDITHGMSFEGHDVAYQNAASCPDCGAGMVRQGLCFSCPLCGMGSCAV